jgi:hypothetical protein
VIAQSYGQLRMLLSKAAPGIDLELVDNWIQTRYTERVLSAIPWKRSENVSVLQSPASVNSGTVTVNQGSNAITGVGTAWTAALTGLMIRIGCGPEYYQFTYASATTGTLDRNYEGSTGAILTSSIGAAGTGYALGDQFTVSGGVSPAVGTVTGIGAGGSVTAYQFLDTNAGSGYSPANGVATSSPGAGSGFTVNILTVAPGTGLSYRIDQAVFLLPSNARILNGVYPMHNRDRGLELISPAELNRRAPQRLEYGTPRWAAHSWDNATTQMQVELFPIPSSPNYGGNTISHVVDYVYDPAPLTSATATSLLAWMSNGAMFNGVMADIAMFRATLPKSSDLFLPDGLAIAQSYEAMFTDYLDTMGKINAGQRGQVNLRLSDEFSGNGGSGYPFRRGPRHEGWPG